MSEDDRFPEALYAKAKGKFAPSRGVRILTWSVRAVAIAAVLALAMYLRQEEPAAPVLAQAPVPALPAPAACADVHTLEDVKKLGLVALQELQPAEHSGLLPVLPMQELDPVNDAMPGWRGDRVQRTRAPRLAPGEAVTVRAATEIGYAPHARQRGCVADLAVGAGTFPFAYILGPVAAQDGAMGITGAANIIVRHRFSHIDQYGYFADRAQPVGSQELTRAFRQGLAHLPPDFQVNDIMLLARAQDEAKWAKPAFILLDLEPLRHCADADAAGRRVCPVLLEMRDPGLRRAGVTHPSAVAMAVTLQRGTQAGTWEVSAQFPGELKSALLLSRMPFYEVAVDMPSRRR